MAFSNGSAPRPRRPEGENAPRTARKKTPVSGGEIVLRGVKGTVSIVFKTIATIFLIMVITGSIVACVMAVYVVGFLDEQTEFDLRNLDLNYTTTLYASNAETTEPYPLQVIKGNENRTPVDFSKIPWNVQLASMAAEDKRFQTHQGVDWKMTFKAFLNMFKGDETTGGSTITQQLIKNISGEKEMLIERKIKEIFRALSLEKEYSKDDIMEAYLNTATTGNNVYGVQAAANLFFDKDVMDLDVAESAAILAITQNPSKYELLGHEEANRDRRIYVLNNMLEIESAQLKAQYEGKTKTEYGSVPTGVISKSEYEKQQKALEEKYEAAKKQKLVIKTSAAQQTRKETYSYFVDYVIDEVIKDLGTQLGMEKQAAWNMVYNGGLSIYTTVDESIQGLLDEDFITNELEYDAAKSIFQKVNARQIVNGGRGFGEYMKEQPQCAMIIMDYEGNIKGIAGGRGEKTGDRTFNLATDGVRQTGSSIKPISVYAPAIDLDLVHWSYLTQDSPFGYLVNGQLVRSVGVKTVTSTDAEGNTVEKQVPLGNGWPTNYYNSYRGMLTVNQALQNSVNTIAVKTLDLITPQVSYDFLHNNLGINGLDTQRDIDYAPLALGAQSGGISVLDMTAAYQIFGNGGLYYEPHSYSKVVDNQGNVLLESNGAPRRVIAEDSAEVMNKLLQSVVTGGTGGPAKLGNLPVMGKTGTSDMDKDQWFIGGTPYYVAGVWYGFDKENAGIPSYNPYPPPQIWQRVMNVISKTQPYKEFPVSGAVVQKTYCLDSGDLAAPSCSRTASGWYKQGALPGICTYYSGVKESQEVTGGTEDAASSDDEIIVIF